MPVQNYLRCKVTPHFNEHHKCWILELSMNIIASEGLEIVLDGIYGVEAAMIQSRYTIFVRIGKMFEDEKEEIMQLIAQAVTRWAEYDEN